MYIVVIFDKNRFITKVIGPFKDQYISQVVADSYLDAQSVKVTEP